MTYTHLSTSERYQIERWLSDGLPIGDIADLLARARSTIYRELGRWAALTTLNWHNCTEAAVPTPRPPMPHGWRPTHDAV